MTYILKIFICPSSGDDGCLVTNFACQKWCDFSKNKGNLIKPSSRIVTDRAAVTVMTTDLVLHQFFSWKRQSGFGSRNCHGVEVLCCDFFGLQTLVYFLQTPDEPTILQLNLSKQELVCLFSRDGEQRLSEKTPFLPHRALFNHQPTNYKNNLSP